MATTETINGVEVRVQVTPNGKIYSKNFRSMKDECAKAGTLDFAINESKHAFFLGSEAYYIGPSLQGKSVDELISLGKDIQICDSSINGDTWVPCLFLSTNQKRGSFSF